MAAPGATAGIAREPARAGGEFVLHGHGGANGTGGRHMASEPDQIWMRDVSVGDVDGEVIGRIAGPSLGHEGEVPGSIIGRPSLGERSQGSETGRGCCAKQEFLHRHLLQSAGSIAPDVGRS